MDSRSNLREQDVSDRVNNRVIAFFPQRAKAYEAIGELRLAGFTHNEIGFVSLDDSSDSSSEQSGISSGNSSVSGGTSSAATSESGSRDRSFWQEVKDFFSGDSHDNDDREASNYYSSDADDFSSYSSDLNLSSDRSNYYSSGINRGGALVTVTGPRSQEARVILERHGGDLRESGFENVQSDVRNDLQSSRLTGSDNAANAEQRRIQLRGELLQVQKERVQRGEVRLRKEVVTENQTLEVPVTREELVIERTGASGTPATGRIGEDEEIRVPLSEERVHVDKKPVVNEEVRVSKRQVQNTQRVSDDVSHEELRVENEGDVAVDDSTSRTNRKKPAA
jgi:uncharacterized protein (TIGR02271 family)